MLIYFITRVLYYETVLSELKFFITSNEIAEDKRNGK